MLSEIIPLKNKRVLVCPLDWGLGHTARCIPLIKALQNTGNHVIVAANVSQKDFIQQEISGVEFVDLAGYEVRYSESVPLWMALLIQYRRLKAAIKKEHAWLENFLKINKIDVVISDNRFGLFSSYAETIFVTHQVFVKAPFLTQHINSINRSYIEKFDALWVVDNEDEKTSLAGELSHGKHFHTKVSYIGPLSRFAKSVRPAEKEFDVLVLLSGVEPQRTLLEEKCVKALQNSKLKVCLVRGTNLEPKLSYPEIFTVMNISRGEELERLLCSSKNIICRSGYSSLMDLHALELKAVLIPTPGQTEQEYLAEYWKEKFGFVTLDQRTLTEEGLLKVITR